MLNDIVFLDDATRPEAPKLDGVTAAQKAPGRHLRMIHNHLRENTAYLRNLVDSIASGEVDASEAADKAEALEMVANYRQFGNLCGQHCQFVHAHHSIEDAHVFPGLSAKGEAWKKVVDRLVAEHEIVHELLMRLIAALRALADNPDTASFKAARELNAALERVLLSHLGYEEDSIGDALGYYNIGV